VRKLVFALAIAGLIAGCIVAYVSGLAAPPLPPVFTPARDPYPNGIYAQGIIESAQPNGANVSVFPEVAGTVKSIPVTEGQDVKRGEVLLMIDDATQRATTAQLRLQAQSAFVTLEQLRVEPRKESLDVAEAQVASAATVAKTAEDAYARQRKAYDLDPRAISRNSLDSAANTVASARASLDVARKQRNLIAAGAWSYEIETQARQYDALYAAYQSASALLGKYTLRAPSDGRVLAINASVGSYVSAQGAFDTYTQGADPVLVLEGSRRTQLQVRCFVDEILVPRLPAAARMTAQMSPRGSSVRIPLEFLRIQPLLTPKTQLSDQRQERVDVRVLPILFRFSPPRDVVLYPGQLVDVFIGG
jgi:HlyD family secretion protein